MISQESSHVVVFTQVQQEASVLVFIFLIPCIIWKTGRFQCSDHLQTLKQQTDYDRWHIQKHVQVLSIAKTSVFNEVYYSLSTDKVNIFKLLDLF